MKINDCCAGYAKRVRELEEKEGLTTSDAQGVADVEHKKIHSLNRVHKMPRVKGVLKQNRKRASRVEEALRSYDKEVENGQDMQTSLTDFLTDLRHLADVLILDFESSVMTSKVHYAAEVKNERRK